MRRTTFDYRRHLEMQVSDCVIKCIFPSTSTLLNPMKPSSQSFVRKILLGKKPVLPSYSSLFCPEFDHMPNFFRTFCFHLGIVCFCNPMACSGISRERPDLFSPHFQTLFKTLFWCQLRRQTNKQTDTQTNKQANGPLYSKTTFIRFCFFHTLFF